VREGDTVNRGQVLSDKEAERARLNRDKRERLLAIANVEGQLIPMLQPAPALRELPPISYTVEETAIQLAEIKLAQAQRNLATVIEADPFISAKAKVERSLADVEAAHRAFELQQRKIDAVNGLRGLPPEMLTHETEKLRQARTFLEGKEADDGAVAATVQRVIHLGWEIQVELLLTDKTTVMAYLNREQRQRLNPQVGQKVFIKPRVAKVFAGTETVSGNNSQFIFSTGI
jgi:multidrug efflux pump subunit AcrA (membrane-fusion protein)